MLRQSLSRALRNAGAKPLQRPMLFRSLHATLPPQKDEEPLPPTFSQKYQLSEPTRWVPLVVGGFGAATATGLYHWDAESQMLGLFVLFVGTIYSQGGDAIGKFFDETSDAILKEQLAIEETQMEAVKMALEANKRQTAIYGDTQEILNAQKVLTEQVVAAAGASLKHEVRNIFVKKLDTIAQMEANIQTSVRDGLVSSASDYVREQFAQDSGSLKDEALANALAAIEDPKSQKDVVGDLYNQYFGNFRSKLEDMTGKEHELSAAAVEEAADVVRSLARRDNLEPITPPKKVLFDGL